MLDFLYVFLSYMYKSTYEKYKQQKTETFNKHLVLTNTE